MQSNIFVSSRLVLALAGTLVLGACAAESAASDAPAAPDPTAAPVATIPPTTVGPSVTVAPTTAPPVVTTPPVDLPEITPGPCGAYGPLPALPDSMPTVLYDTDGDGAVDDEVTAYGAEDGWRVRFVENGITSEALALNVTTWGYLGEHAVVDGRDHIVVVPNDDPGNTWYFTTDDDGCAHPVLDDPEHQPIDDLVAPTPQPTLPPAPVDKWAAPEPAGDDDDDDMMCGPLPDVPVDAVIGTELWLDLDGGDADDDRIVSYLHGGTWYLRGEIAGAQSEITVPGAGVHGVRVLGFADVDETYGGEEIVAVVGGGASAQEIGFFSFLEGGCIFRYQHEDGGDFGVLVGASVMWGEGLRCSDGLIHDWGFQHEDDDTWTMWSGAYQPVSLGTFGLVPDVDGYYEEGLDADDIDQPLFDCLGLAL
ncbi:MAG: hypothetical protein R2697_00360 [Ilumatobacteraceae bacterium]